MYEINQIVFQDNKYVYSKKANLQYPRHGHSCCSLGENYVVVTGSRKDISKAPFKTEIYSIYEDKWMEMG